MGPVTAMKCQSDQSHHFTILGPSREQAPEKPKELGDKPGKTESAINREKPPSLKRALNKAFSFERSSTRATGRRRLAFADQAGEFSAQRSLLFREIIESGHDLTGIGNLRTQRCILSRDVLERDLQRRKGRGGLRGNGFVIEDDR